MPGVVPQRRGSDRRGLPLARAPYAGASPSHDPTHAGRARRGRPPTPASAAAHDGGRTPPDAELFATNNTAVITEPDDPRLDDTLTGFTRDVRGIAMDAAGVEEVDTLAGGGADTFAVGDMTGTPVQFSHAEGAADTLAVDTRGGEDAVDSSGLAPGTIGLEVR
jgi:hypothetical protein